MLHTPWWDNHQSSSPPHCHSFTNIPGGGGQEIRREGAPRWAQRRRERHDEVLEGAEDSPDCTAGFMVGERRPTLANTAPQGHIWASPGLSCRRSVCHPHEVHLSHLPPIASPAARRGLSGERLWHAKLGSQTKTGLSPLNRTCSHTTPAQNQPNAGPGLEPKWLRILDSLGLTWIHLDSL